MTINDKLLAAIKSRSKNGTKTLFGQGILTADRYVKSVVQAVGTDACFKYACPKGVSVQDIIEKSAKRLVYRNEDMTLEGDPVRASNVSEMKRILSIGGRDLEMPKNALMVFKHCLTTPRIDRDKDTLQTSGAIPDEKMLLLWQHIHTLPIGKMLGIAEHTDEKLSPISAIVDTNPLAHDAAVMVDNDMARFSHGFRALEFEQRKAEDGEEEWEVGFNVTKYEIMEESVVSVPSNVDAEVENIIVDLAESGKLTSPLMKEHAKQLREKMPSRIAVTDQIGDYKRTVESDSVKGVLDTMKGLEDEEHRTGQKTGGTTGKSKKGNKPSSPEETDGPPEDKSGNTEDSKNNEGLKSCCFWPGQVKNSWESCEQQLDKAARSHFRDMDGMDNRYFWRVATFEGEVIFCAEHYESGHEKEFMYMKCSWEKGEDGSAKFTDECEEVELELTMESAAERSPHTQEKKYGPGWRVKDISTQEAMASLLAHGDEKDLMKMANMIQQRHKNTKRKKSNERLRQALKG